MASKVIRVDVVSDVHCPWCWVGKRSIEMGAALAGVNVELRWLPFQLGPELPMTGVDKMLRYTQKFGPGAEAMLKDPNNHLRQRGRTIGIDFRYHDGSLLSNTLPLHQVIHAAGQVSTVLQNSVHEEIFHAFHTDGADMSQQTVVVSAAVKGGMSPAAAEAALTDEKTRDEVKKLIRKASAQGIHGVPHFTFPNGEVISGGESPENFARVLKSC